MLKWGLWSSAKKRPESPGDHSAMTGQDGAHEEETGMEPGGSQGREPGVGAWLNSSFCQTWKLYLRSLMHLCFLHFFCLFPSGFPLASDNCLQGQSVLRCCLCCNQRLCPCSKPRELSPACPFGESQLEAFYIINIWLRSKEPFKKRP